MTNKTLPALYILTDDYKILENIICDVESDEIAITDALENLQLQIREKAENISKFIMNLESTANSIKTAEANMAKRRKAMEKRAEYLRAYVKNNLELVNINKLELPLFRISIRNNPGAVVIYDPAAIPDEFLVYPEQPAPYPDKTAIANAIKSGRSVNR